MSLLQKTRFSLASVQVLQHGNISSFEMLSPIPASRLFTHSINIKSYVIALFVGILLKIR